MVFKLVYKFLSPHLFNVNWLAAVVGDGVTVLVAVDSIAI